MTKTRNSILPQTYKVDGRFTKQYNLLNSCIFVFVSCLQIEKDQPNKQPTEKLNKKGHNNITRSESQALNYKNELETIPACTQCNQGIPGIRGARNTTKRK